MAEDPIPTAEPEISAPPPTAPPSPARPDPGVIDGEATEIRDEAAAATEAPLAEEAASPPPDESARLAAYAAPAAAGLGGAILGAALALLAVWLIAPRAGALDDVRARVAEIEKTTETQSVATAALAWLIGISVSLIVDESPPCASVHARAASEKKSLSADTPTVLPLRSAPVLIGASARTIKPITGGNAPSYSPPGAIQISGRPRECAVHSDVTLDLAI